jgi:hypothetical protein
MIEITLFFIFIFSILTALRVIGIFISSVISNPPQKLELSKMELIVFGLAVSYFITYIIKI